MCECKSCGDEFRPWMNDVPTTELDYCQLCYFGDHSVVIESPSQFQLMVLDAYNMDAEEELMAAYEDCVETI